MLEGQLRESYGRVVYTHKTQEECADLLLERLAVIKVAQIILSALTTGGFVSVFLGSGDIGAGAGAVLSTALLALNAYTRNYDLGGEAQKHREAAASIWFMRERYLALLTDLAIGARSVDEIIEERDNLLEDLQTVYATCPSTNDKAYKRAQRALKLAGDMSFCDEEIDAFLPKELRRSASS